MLSSFPSYLAGRVYLAVGTAAIWALAAGGLAYWALHWPKAEQTLALSPAVAAPRTGDLFAPVSRALGHSDTQAAAPELQSSSAYRLLGVIASASGQGSALIATDAQPPRAYRVGQALEEGWTLVSLTATQARLKSPTAETWLELPPSGKP